MREVGKTPQLSDRYWLQSEVAIQESLKSYQPKLSNSADVLMTVAYI